MKQLKVIKHNQGIALFIALAFLLVSTILGLSALKANIFAEKMTHNTILREQAFEAAEFALIEGELFAKTFADQIAEKVFLNSSTNDISDISDPKDDGYQENNDGDNCTVVVDSHGGICIASTNTEAYSNAIGTTNTTGSGKIPLEHWIDITNTSLDSASTNTISNNVWSTTAKHRVASTAIATAYDLKNPPKYIVEFTGYSLDADGRSNCPIGGGGPNADEPDPDIQETWPYCYLDRKGFRITTLATAGNDDEVRIMLQTNYVTN